MVVAGCGEEDAVVLGDTITQYGKFYHYEILTIVEPQIAILLSSSKQRRRALVSDGSFPKQGNRTKAR